MSAFSPPKKHFPVDKGTSKWRRVRTASYALAGWLVPKVDLIGKGLHERRHCPRGPPATLAAVRRSIIGTVHTGFRSPISDQPSYHFPARIRFLQNN